MKHHTYSFSEKELENKVIDPDTYNFWENSFEEDNIQGSISPGSSGSIEDMQYEDRYERKQTVKLKVIGVNKNKNLPCLRINVELFLG